MNVDGSRTSVDAVSFCFLDAILCLITWTFTHVYGLQSPKPTKTTSFLLFTPRSQSDSFNVIVTCWVNLQFLFHNKHVKNSQIFQTMIKELWQNWNIHLKESKTLFKSDRYFTFSFIKQNESIKEKRSVHKDQLPLQHTEHAFDTSLYGCNHLFAMTLYSPSRHCHVMTHYSRALL